MTNRLRYVLTGIVVLIATVFLYWEYKESLLNPWTRDGQVAAQVIQIAPRVSGPIVELPVVNNQFVKQGQLLFKIDPSIFKLKLDSARANLQRIKNELEAMSVEVQLNREQVREAEAELGQAQQRLKNLRQAVDENNRQKANVVDSASAAGDERNMQANTSVRVEQAEDELRQIRFKLAAAREELAKSEDSRGEIGKNNSLFRQAKAELELAELNMKFVEVRAPASGYITNLKLRIGSQVVQDEPAIALIDTSSYWIYGFFLEDDVSRMQLGDKAIVTLIAYPHIHLEGEVQSIDWGIARENGSKGGNLLANVKPTFAWIRLAQRIPVNIVLKEVPESVQLRVGTTASIVVQTKHE